MVFALAFSKKKKSGAWNTDLHVVGLIWRVILRKDRQEREVILGSCGPVQPGSFYRNYGECSANQELQKEETSMTPGPSWQDGW